MNFVPHGRIRHPYSTFSLAAQPIALSSAVARIAGWWPAFLPQRDRPISVRPDAIMEIQRRVAMSTMMSRVASEDFDWNGHRIAKGDFVLLFQAAANRDPAIFANPDKLDCDRIQSQNLTFAPGVHHCAGFQIRTGTSKLARGRRSRTWPQPHTCQAVWKTRRR
jgi:cytochrome P450